MYYTAVKNAIYTAALSGTEWMDSSLVHAVDNALFEMAVGETDGRLSVAYIQDEDNSFDTTGDQNLYIITGENVTLAANGCTGSVTFERLPGTESNAFIWNDGDTLRTSNGDTITLQGISGEYTITGDCIYFSAATDTGAELTVAKYDNGSWSVPITLTEGDSLVVNAAFTFEDPGATAKDYLGMDLTDRITVEGRTVIIK